MVMQVRRVVTGHDEKGVSIIATDEVLSAKSRGQGHNIEGIEMWTPDRMPVDNAPSDDARQRSGLVKRDEDPHMNFINTGGGSVIRIIEWQPGHARFTHRTETLDYIVILSGEIDLEVDNGVTTTLKTGDTLIQRGGMHTWVNKGDVPAVMAAILIDATPVEIDGKLLHYHFPESAD